ncbi:NfeD family protein [Sansalvadorimonas verongulae]|nr:NfeD family protein [Sansalvadorimonas verongulae]
MSFIAELQPWHWVVFCFLLLGMEALGAGGFLLGAAAAAVLQGFLLWLVPDMGWAVQFSVFGAGALIFTVVWWFFLRKSGQNSEEPLLNDRAAQMVGRIVVLDQNLPGGHGRIQIGDTKWKVRANQTLEAGATVVVVGSEGMTLFIESDR